jgi:hypothetical protein
MIVFLSIDGLGESFFNKKIFFSHLGCLFFEHDDFDEQDYLVYPSIFHLVQHWFKMRS